MNLISYIKQALSPGGTESRYLIWVIIVLIAQVLASTYPSGELMTSEWNASKILTIATCSIALATLLVKKNDHKIWAAYGLYIIGLFVCTYTIVSGITELTGIVFMLTWAMTLFIAERREYISFGAVTVFMIVMLISTVVVLSEYPVQSADANWLVLYVGAIITAIDIYLVYTDFGFGKNFYKESRESFANLDHLSDELSRILSEQGNLEDLLWKVAERCVPFLKIEECVIYLYDEDIKALKQVAAYGGKSDSHEIIDPITIQPGEGIVGKTFSTGEYTCVDELSLNADYIVDDAERSSELSVPILSNGVPVGVIDSEHSVNGFFKARHFQAFKIMAAFCGIKIAELQAQEDLVDAEKMRQEATRYMELDQLKNRFITNISHDLKTPLSLIKAPAMQIARSSTDDSIKNSANYIMKNTEHLLRVVNQLLQLNRVDQGLNELYIEKVDLRNLVTKIDTQYKGLAEKDNVVFL